MADGSGNILASSINSAFSFSRRDLAAFLLFSFISTANIFKIVNNLHLFFKSNFIVSNIKIVQVQAALKETDQVRPFCLFRPAFDSTTFPRRLGHFIIKFIGSLTPWKRCRKANESVVQVSKTPRPIKSSITGLEKLAAVAFHRWNPQSDKNGGKGVSWTNPCLTIPLDIVNTSPRTLSDTSGKLSFYLTRCCSNIRPGRGGYHRRRFEHLRWQAEMSKETSLDSPLPRWRDEKKIGI